jgi:hypothetical protein
MRSILIFFILLSFFSCQKIRDYKLARIKSVNDSLSLQNLILSNSLRSNYLYGFDHLNPRTFLINEKFDTVKFTSIFIEPYTLVFYYSNYACSPCLERELQLLRSENDSIAESRLCIVGATTSMRSIAAVIRNYNFQCRLFQLEGRHGIFDNQPFMQESMFLLVNKEGIIETLLVPPKNDDQTIGLFFSFVNAHFLK